MVAITQKEFEIKSYEVSANTEIKPYSILHFLEDVAYHNAKEIGVGYEDTVAKHQGFFLIKYHLKFNLMPKMSDIIKAKTWIVKAKSIQCRREFELSDINNNIIGVASSLWLLVDLNTKKILNPYKELTYPDCEENYAFDTTFPKIPIINKVDFESEINITFDDIDLNSHVNNANYLKFALNTLPADFLKNNSVCEINILYKKETILGETIISQAQLLKEKNATLHILKNKATGEELTTLEIFFKTI